MITIEQYARTYLAILGTAGNDSAAEEICMQNGFSLADWKAAQTHFTAKMQDISDGGKTALAFAAGMTGGVSNPASQEDSDKPRDFKADSVEIYLSEYDVEMVEFKGDSRDVFLTIQMTTTTDDAARGFGGDQAHLCFNDQSYSIYGGVEKVILDRNRVQFVFDDLGRERMCCDSVTISFLLHGNDYAALSRKFKWIFNGYLEIGIGADIGEHDINGMYYSDDVQHFAPHEAMEVDIRTSLDEVINSGKYKYVFFVDYKYDPTQDLSLQREHQRALSNKLAPVFEQDQAGFLALTTHSESMSRMYIYLSIPTDEAIERLNTALYRIPEMPLELGGGADETWENYKNCLNDYLASKN